MKKTNILKSILKHWLQPKDEEEDEEEEQEEAEEEEQEKETEEQEEDEEDEDEEEDDDDEEEEEEIEEEEEEMREELDVLAVVWGARCGLQLWRGDPYLGTFHFNYHICVGVSHSLGIWALSHKLTSNDGDIQAWFVQLYLPDSTHMDGRMRDCLF